MMTFFPKQPEEGGAVPFFEDVDSEGGWRGMATTKSLATLKSEVAAAIARLGGFVTQFQRGAFELNEQRREGYRVTYSLADTGGQIGRLNVAALPIKQSARRRKSADARKDKSLRMALFMLRDALDGQWFLQQLSPGYAPLMPWMLADGERTITQLWSEGVTMKRLLPPPGEFVEGDFEVISP